MKSKRKRSKQQSSNLSTAKIDRRWFDELRTREFEISSEMAALAVAVKTDLAKGELEPWASIIDDDSQWLVSSPVLEIASQALEPLIDPSEFEHGIQRSQRGTIEYIMHPTGTAIKPKYNLCGILMSVEFNDGSKIVRGNGPTPWSVLDSHGNEVAELQIITLSMDVRGNVLYRTTDGVQVTIYCDGTVSRKAA